MSAIPLRLVVIQVSIPTGESCKGCQYGWGRGTIPDIPAACSDPHISPYDRDSVPFSWHTITRGIRLPACRERDGYAVYPPGSGVKELVEAAKVYTVASDAANEAKEEHGMGSSKVVPYINANTTARWALQDAARKVAREVAK